MEQGKHGQGLSGTSWEGLALGAGFQHGCLFSSPSARDPVQGDYRELSLGHPTCVSQVSAGKPHALLCSTATYWMAKLQVLP